MFGVVTPIRASRSGALGFFGGLDFNFWGDECCISVYRLATVSIRFLHDMLGNTVSLRLHIILASLIVMQFGSTQFSSP